MRDKEPKKAQDQNDEKPRVFNINKKESGDNELVSDKKEVTEQEKEPILENMTKEDLLLRLKDVEEKAEKNFEMYLRTYAEMENLKKRNKREREDLAKFANESLIKEILPVIDNLDQAISHAQDNENHASLIEGVELTLSGLMKTLEKAGLKKVEAKGKPFDPNFHEAISQQKDDTIPPGHVTMELQKGYMLNGRLIRPSIVIVSQGSGGKAGETD